MADERGRRGIVVLGSTGSIGTQTLDVIRALDGRFHVVGLAAGANRDLLTRQITEFDVPYASCADALLGLPDVVECPMEEMVCLPEVDLVVVATSSTRAMHATLAALEVGKAVATANKEVLVAAGELVLAAAERGGGQILPIDGEHSAVWQCLRGEESDEIERVILTASGGPFRDLPLGELERVTPADALRHPVWRMGNKITVDTATLANKAFEVIEAHWLFRLAYSKIGVVIHRESIVHAVVQFADGSSKAQLSLPDMRVPIQYALLHPSRVPGRVQSLDLVEMARLSFAEVEHARYPAFRLIVDAGRAGGTFPAAVSAANDEAVDAFMAGRIGFCAIASAIEAALSAHQSIARPDLDALLESERWARAFVRDWVAQRVHSPVAGA